jgi:hypothetical protein
MTNETEKAINEVLEEFKLDEKDSKGRNNKFLMKEALRLLVPKIQKIDFEWFDKTFTRSGLWSSYEIKEKLEAKKKEFGENEDAR